MNIWKCLKRNFLQNSKIFKSIRTLTNGNLWPLLKIYENPQRPLLLKYLSIKIDSLGLANGEVFEFATTPSLLTLETQREWHSNLNEVARIKKLFYPKRRFRVELMLSTLLKAVVYQASESSGIHLCFFISTPNVTTPSLSLLASCRLRKRFAVTMQSFHRVANDWKSFSTIGSNRKASFSLCVEKILANERVSRLSEQTTS